MTADIRCCSCAEPARCPNGHNDGVMDVNATRGHVEMLLGFVECDVCKEKPGAPVLCNGCLHNRKRAQELKEQIEQSQSWREVVEQLRQQRADLKRANDRDVLRLRSANARREVSEHELQDMSDYVTTLEDHITDLDLKIGELKPGE